ncbi:MAG TPA: hypothetical protein VNM45_09345 [Bacillus sp. (in: firmicutes)]|nr:hypothetical protein [Bacillus sp. (in: firmicutes)]
MKKGVTVEKLRMLDSSQSTHPLQTSRHVAAYTAANMVYGRAADDVCIILYSKRNIAENHSVVGTMS